LLAEEDRLWILTTMSKYMPKMSISTIYRSLPMQFLLSNAESELTNAKVPLTVSIHNKFALKLMRYRHSTWSTIRLPALRSEQIRQDNSSFVCLTAARPLRIVQNGENQNQNRTGQTSYAAFVTDTSVFSPLLFPGFTLSQVNVCTKESTLHPSEIFPEWRLPTCKFVSLKRSLVLNY